VVQGRDRSLRPNAVNPLGWSATHPLGPGPLRRDTSRSPLDSAPAEQQQYPRFGDPVTLGQLGHRQPLPDVAGDELETRRRSDARASICQGDLRASIALRPTRGAGGNGYPEPQPPRSPGRRHYRTSEVVVRSFVRFGRGMQTGSSGALVRGGGRLATSVARTPNSDSERSRQQALNGLEAPSSVTEPAVPDAARGQYWVQFSDARRASVLCVSPSTPDAPSKVQMRRPNVAGGCRVPPQSSIRRAPCRRHVRDASAQEGTVRCSSAHPQPACHPCARRERSAMPARATR
jgi:hypothetical protein